jgi:hypothetical protein
MRSECIKIYLRNINIFALHIHYVPSSFCTIPCIEKRERESDWLENKKMPGRHWHNNNNNKSTTNQQTEQQQQQQTEQQQHHHHQQQQQTNSTR